MPATPSWPPESSIRLFVETPLTALSEIRIDGAQAHYLISVMRVKVGTRVKLFDDIGGEWLAEVGVLAKRDLILNLLGHLRPREIVPDLWLAAAPIRRARYDWVAEKACELGIARLVPVLTHRAVVDKVKDDRLRAHMIEAAEQCGRTALPAISPQVRLADWLPTIAGRTIFFARRSTICQSHYRASRPGRDFNWSRRRLRRCRAHTDHGDTRRCGNFTWGSYSPRRYRSRSRRRRVDGA
jgi:16S rRNA (uracil1498-N3)-methyltransferase